MFAGRTRFLHGFAAAFVLFGTLNAGSYFLRSERGGNLLGLHEHHFEAIGFPSQFWMRGHIDSRFNFSAFAVNLALAITAAAAVGVMTARREDWAVRFGAPAAGRSTAWQFTTRGLFLLTTVVAAAVAAGRSCLGHPALLLAMLAFGPALLTIFVACIQRIGLPQRAALLFLLTFSLAAAAVAAGEVQTPPIDAERVLLSLFVCWLPQYTLLGLAVLGRTAFAGARRAAA